MSAPAARAHIKKIAFHAALGLIALLGFSACSKPASVDYRSEIAAATKHFEDVLGSGNTDAIVRLYAEDAVIMAPGLDPVSGRPAIKEFFGGGSDGSTKIEFRTDEVYGEGDFATEVGKTFIKNSEGKLLATAKYVVIWKKVDGQWLIYRDSWNADKDLPSPAETDAAGN